MVHTTPVMREGTPYLARPVNGPDMRYFRLKCLGAISATFANKLKVVGSSKYL